jgi:hypothetical protein
VPWLLCLISVFISLCSFCWLRCVWYTWHFKRWIYCHFLVASAWIEPESLSILIFIPTTRLVCAKKSLLFWGRCTGCIAYMTFWAQHSHTWGRLVSPLANEVACQTAALLLKVVFSITEHCVPGSVVSAMVAEIPTLLIRLWLVVMPVKKLSLDDWWIKMWNMNAHSYNKRAYISNNKLSDGFVLY